MQIGLENRNILLTFAIKYKVNGEKKIKAK